jgi:glycosyl transferase family 25
MIKNIQVFIISLKNNKRRKDIIKRLRKIKINFKIIKGVNGNLYYQKNKLDLIYDKKQTIKNIDRELSPPEIGSAASHLKIYKYILKNKISQAIIMEDDAFPSELLFEWIKNKINTPTNAILSFYAYNGGFLEKKTYKKIINNKISIHRAYTHIFNNSCYQINNSTAKKILKITKNKVCGFADWPFRLKKSKIKLFVTIPFLAFINDKGDSYVKESRKKFTGNNNILKKIIPGRIFDLLRMIYHICYIPFLFRRYKNKEFYDEFFFDKELAKIKNFFTDLYFDLSKIYFEKKYYYNDLKKYLHLRIDDI